MNDQRTGPAAGPSDDGWLERSSKNLDDLERRDAALPDRDERIKRRAYQLWEDEGRPHGRDQAHWLIAQREIDAEGSAPATSDTRFRTGDPPGLARPAEAGMPGASAELGGTPSATAVGPGRQTD